jgi:hypothetical protein
LLTIQKKQAKYFAFRREKALIIVALNCVEAFPWAFAIYFSNPQAPAL